MLFWQLLLIISCLIILYNYIGYALLIYPIILVSRTRKNKVNADRNFSPSVSFIVAAFNEEDCIEEKIKNSFGQQYPGHLMEFIFITDGSSDKTTEIIRQYPAIKLLHQDERKGKSAALNRAVLHATGDILIFSDANTLLNKDATRNITYHYGNTNVGGVAGEKKVIQSANTGKEGLNSEGIYWKYESLLKKTDSDFYSVVGAAGELFSLRRKLYEEIPDFVILDDFIISMKVAQKGYRVIYEPSAYASELPSFSMKDEKKRKIRIAAGGFQALIMLKSLFRFWENPKLFFLYFSHRVLRWTLSPLCIVLALLSSVILFLKGSNPVFVFIFYSQLIFYILAVTGSFVKSNSGISKIPRICYYFVFMNLSVVLGFFRFLKGKQPVTWEKARRMQ